MVDYEEREREKREYDNKCTFYKYERKRREKENEIEKGNKR